VPSLSMRVCASARGIRYARMYVRAILSRFKRLLGLEWYQYTTYGSYALKRAVRCLSAPPLVVCGVVGVAWVCVWAWFVRPLIRTEARRRAVGHAWVPSCMHVYLRRLARVPAYACAYACTYAHTPKPVCASACARTPVCARTRSGTRARTSPYIYNPHPEHYSGNFPRSW